MNKKKNLAIFICVIFITSLSVSFIFSTNTSALTDNVEENTMKPNMLGEIDSAFETHVGFYSFDYLDGTIYGVDGVTSNIYAYDANTGVSTENISITTVPQGITTDGTHLYTTMYTGVTPNGTIFKRDLAGNEISRIQVNIGAGRLVGITWDGSFLWVYQETPSSLLRVHPETGTVVKNISIGFYPHDLTMYKDRLWADYYSTDRVVSFDTNTGEQLDSFNSPYHFDSGIACNGTHFMQSQYISAPFEVSFTKLPTEPGDIFSESYNLHTPVMDCTTDGSTVYFSENRSGYVYGHDINTYGYVIGWDTGLTPVGLSIIYDNFIIVSMEDAPYNFYTYTLDGNLLLNQSALDVMVISLTFDGTNLWAMGIDSVLYKLNPTNMSILAEYNIGKFYGITYDYDRDVIWAVSKAENKVKYIDPDTGEIGLTDFGYTAPITPGEYGITYDGEFLIIITSYDGGRFFKVIPGELDEEPVVTPTPTPSPTLGNSTWDNLPSMYKNLIFFGVGLGSAGFLALVIAIARKGKKTA